MSGLSRFQREQESALTAQAEAIRDDWVSEQIASVGLRPEDPIAIAFRGHVSCVGFNGAPELSEFIAFNQPGTN